LPGLVSPARREGLIARLRERGILAVFHYQPLHLSEMGRRFGGVPAQCLVTEWVSQTLVRLPLFPSLTDAEQENVIEAVTGFRA
jgi:dTDP-4-amino-4,6-dideoxygalactose transaminase